MTLAALSLFAGVALGIRYSLFALVPALFCIICVHVLAIEDPNTARITSAALCMASVQGGYIIGLTARGLVKRAAARVSSRST